MQTKISLQSWWPCKIGRQSARWIQWWPSMSQTVELHRWSPSWETFWIEWQLQSVPDPGYCPLFPKNSWWKAFYDLSWFCHWLKPCPSRSQIQRNNISGPATYCNCRLSTCREITFVISNYSMTSRSNNPPLNATATRSSIWIMLLPCEKKFIMQVYYTNNTIYILQIYWVALCVFDTTTQWE